MKRSMDILTPSPYASISNEERNVMRMLVRRVSHLSHTVVPVKACKDIADAARAFSMLVEEADERMTKPWYRRMPKDIEKLSPSK